MCSAQDVRRVQKNVAEPSMKCRTRDAHRRHGSEREKKKMRRSDAQPQQHLSGFSKPLGSKTRYLQRPLSTTQSSSGLLTQPVVATGGHQSALQLTMLVSAPLEDHDRCHFGISSPDAHFKSMWTVES